jgi:small subunit ribosomal protein S10
MKDDGKKKIDKVIDKTDDKSKLRIKIKAFDHKVINQAVSQIIKTAERSGATVRGPIPLPTEIKKMTVNRSSFKFKKARDQYEIRTHKRLIDIIEPSEGTIGNLTNMDLPAGVGVEIKM